jgi:hypothetical protein
VAREGIAALDPVNGLPLSWNPGRDRGVGAFALVATSQGLWIGSDTDRIGRYEYHGRIAFMPLAGGTPVPESRVGTLPGDLFRLGTDGAMTRRTFDGAPAGFTTPIALNGLTSTQFPISRITGMFFWNGRLYYRWFTPESGILGADTFVASGAADGRNGSTVTGITMASGRLLYATTTGTLSSVAFSAGLPTGTASVVSGPAVDGQTWQSRGLFVLNLPT